MYKRMLVIMLVVSVMILSGCNKSSDVQDVRTEPHEESLSAVVDVEVEQRPEGTVESTESVVATPTITEGSDNPAETTSQQVNETDASEPLPEGTVTTLPVETEPVQKETINTVPPTISGASDYEWYNSLSGDAQMAFFQEFESIEDFVAWYNAAKDEYDRLHPPIEVGSGKIDLGELGK